MTLLTQAKLLYQDTVLGEGGTAWHCDSWHSFVEEEMIWLNKMFQ